MEHITPKKGMLVQLTSVSEIERQNKGTSPVKVGSLGLVSREPDETGIFEVEFLQKFKSSSIYSTSPSIRIACIKNMVQLVIDQKLEKKVTTVTTALVTKDFKKV